MHRGRADRVSRRAGGRRLARAVAGRRGRGAENVNLLRRLRGYSGTADGREAIAGRRGRGAENVNLLRRLRGYGNAADRREALGAVGRGDAGARRRA